MLSQSHVVTVSTLLSMLVLSQMLLKMVVLSVDMFSMDICSLDVLSINILLVDMVHTSLNLSLPDIISFILISSIRLSLS